MTIWNAVAQGSLLLFAEILGGETARDTGGGACERYWGGGLYILTVH